MRKSVAVKLVSGMVVSSVGVTLAFMTTQSAGLPAQRQAAISAPAVEWCTAGVAGPQGPGCASLPRSTAYQDAAQLPPVPTFEPSVPLMASAAGDEIRAYIESVLAYARSLQSQVQAATAAPSAPDLAPAAKPQAEAIRDRVQEQTQAIQKQAQQNTQAVAAAVDPPKASDLPNIPGLPHLDLPPNATAEEIAEAIRERVQEQIEDAWALARQQQPSSPSRLQPPSANTDPGCTTEQRGGSNWSSTAISCIQQQVRTDGASISSVVTASSSVSSSTTSSD